MLRSSLLLCACASAQCFSVGVAPIVSAKRVNPSALTALERELGKQLRTAAVAAVASIVLVASPMAAHAKGGGHGGGGHGGGGHSHSSHSSRPSYPRSATLSSQHPSVRSTSSARSSSSSRRSSRRSGESVSYSSSSYERELRIFPTTAEAREGGGLYCPATLPSVGSKVDIAGVGSATVLQSQPALQSGLYDGGMGSQPLPPGFDAGCTLQVQYADGSTDMVSSAQEPPSALEEVLSVAIWPVYLGFILWDSKGSNMYGDYKKKHERFLKDAGAAKGLGLADLTSDSAMSGEYWGASAESDDGDQSVRVHLRFGSGGRLSGHGRDGADGSYKLKGGRWMVDDVGKVQLGWREKYDEGFEAICFGEYDAKTGKIRGKFESSRSVGGSFELAKKPSVF